jgi:hypothetical protein
MFQFQLLLISSHCNSDLLFLLQKYLNFAAYSKNLPATFISPHQCLIRLVCLSLQHLCFLKPEIHIISTEQKLTWPTQFQSLLIYVDVPKGNTLSYEIKTSTNRYEYVSTLDACHDGLPLSLSL